MHWLSTYTGEVVEDFPTLVLNIIRTVKHYGTSWRFSEILKFCFCWKYSRTGF